MEPGRAFDAISKVLFIKMFVERSGQHGTFTTAYLKERAKYVSKSDKPIHEVLFEDTRAHYAGDEIFAEGETLDISEPTFRRLVKELEPFNLSATGDDVKGLAFERFLGSTFRGNLGQYFTPRPVVDFMVEVLDPQPGELVCDPASGSGGFLIKAFEHVRAQIEAEVDAEKERVQREVEAAGLDPDETTERIDAAFAELNRDLDPDNRDGRLYALSRLHVFGTDAEPRAARTAKMNMIMHGDGHGGIHFHDGLVDVNGIFPGRFDVVLSNPPFGASVGADQLVGATEQTRVADDAATRRRGRERYGAGWEAAHAVTKRAADDKAPVLSLYEIGAGKSGRPTELLFLERCLQLLRPGGRMGIILPDGNLNNPSLGWLRRWAEGKATLRGVVSLPEDTFKGAAASVKASVVFLRRYTDGEAAAWDAAWQTAHADLDPAFAARRDALVAEHAGEILSGGDRAVAEALAAFDGGGRVLPDWQLAEPPDYPRGVVKTTLGNPRWENLPRGADAKARAKGLRAAYEQAWTDAHDQAADAELRTLRRALRRIDAEHQAALWQHVRAAVDYPVLTAAPDHVGITSTGASTERNELPETRDAIHEVWDWIDDHDAAPGAEPVLAA